MPNRINELLSIMESAPEFKLYKKLSHFDYTRSLCDKNKDDLMQILEEIDSIININLEGAYYSVIHEITRRFINHIGTEFLFIEFMSRENKRLSKLGMGIHDYSEHVTKTFAVNENTNFVKQLRNHAIHFSMLDIKIISSISPRQGNCRSKATLNINDLLKDTNWNTFSKKYIKKHSPTMDLQICMQEYSHTQNDFYKWYRESYSTQFARELKYCDDINNEWNKIIGDLQKKLEKMTFEEKMSLPKIEINQPADDDKEYSIKIEKLD